MRWLWAKTSVDGRGYPGKAKGRRVETKNQTPSKTRSHGVDPTLWITAPDAAPAHGAATRYWHFTASVEQKAVY